MIRGAEALGRVAQHPQALAGADRLDGVVIGRLAEKVDGDDARRPEVHPPRGRDRKLEARRVEVEAVLDDVDEDRRRAEPRHHLGRRREGEARADHRVAGADAFRHQHHGERVGAVGAGDDVARAAEGRKLRFERRDLRPEDVGAMVDDAQDRLVHCGADARALGAKVDEGQGRGHQAISSRRSGAVSR